MQRLIVLNIISLIIQLIPARLVGQILPEEAAKVASHFIASKSEIPQQKLLDSKIAQTYTHCVDGVTLWYIFNLAEGGFVITSADKRIFPVLAWSSVGEFDPSSIPENCAVWMTWYENQILQLKNDSQVKAFDFENDWLILLENTSKSSLSEGIQPLLTAKWDQGEFFNALCPEDPGGINGHVPVGCVAVAMAQIMYYYRFPEQGKGFHSYTPAYNNGIYGLQYADFANTSYQWNQMVDQCLTDNHAVAELCYHAAVAVNMSFTPMSSGANVTSAATAMYQHFNYLPNSQVVLRQNAGGYELWQQMMVNNLENGQPLLYFSNNGFQGHAYVCDGYADSVHFHFNWGWSGNHNGFYYIDELIPGGIDLSQNQGGIFNIYPDTTLFDYPAFCQEGKLLTSSIGSLTDGSGPLNYQNGTSCSWLIKPDDPDMTNLRLDFSMFDLNPGSDFLFVYNGENINAPLLGSFSGNTLPPVIISAQPSLFLSLETSETMTGKGFQANYHAFSLPFCQGLTVISSPEGTFNDGSDYFNYSNNMDCSWLLAPVVPIYDSVEKIIIRFTGFNLASGDTLFVHDGSDYSSPLLASHSGNELPPEFTSSGHKLFFNFRTNENDSASGWEMNYTPVPPVYCSDTTFLTESSGIIQDGSGDKHYNANTYCHWKIHASEAEFVTIEFTKVDMELNYDYVLIRDLNKPYSAPVSITGNTIPPPFTISSNRVLITFFSDHLKNHSGWELQYHASAESITSRFLHHFAVYPNPVTDVLVIRQKTNELKDFTCTIFDLQGKELFTNQQAFPELALDMKNFQKGVYLLEIKTENHAFRHKIVKF